MGEGKKDRQIDGKTEREMNPKIISEDSRKNSLHLPPPPTATQGHPSRNPIYKNRNESIWKLRISKEANGGEERASRRWPAAAQLIDLVSH